MTIVVGLGMSGTAVAEKHNPDQHFNFDCSHCQQDTTVDNGHTNIYVQCYGKNSDNFNCSSPEAGITCYATSDTQGSLCQCTSNNSKAHTVKVKMYGCSQ